MIDVTDLSFEADVLTESMTRPVVVDLWAPWCGPCKTLGPLIEKVVAETGGKVLLAKINVDENPAASQAFQVQSIPAVYAMKDGQIIDGFMGAKPEAEIREFVQKLIPSLADMSTDELLAIGDEESLLLLLERDPNHEQANLALAMLLIDSGKNEQALPYLEKSPPSPQVQALLDQIQAEVSSQQGEMAEVESRLGQLLDQVKDDDEARSEFLGLLETLGAENPQTAEWRRKLSTRLF